MICEKCERIGRLNLIPHEVVTGDDGIAEAAECPWEWEREEILQYVRGLWANELETFLEENPGYRQAYLNSSLTKAQKATLEKFVFAVFKKREDRLKML